MMIQTTISFWNARSPGGGADYVVSGDKDLLRLGEFQGTRIVTPAEFLAILEGRA